MPDLNKDHPITRKGFRWEFKNKKYWFKRNAENARVNYLIMNLAPSSYAYHVKQGTKGY